TSPSRSATAGCGTAAIMCSMRWCAGSAATSSTNRRLSSPRPAPTRTGTVTGTGTVTTATPISLGASLRLWQLISPSLPVGAYAYSSALEHVVETGGVRSEHDAAEWIEGVLHGLARTDLPILLRVHGAVAARDLERAIEWCRPLVAMREAA